MLKPKSVSAVQICGYAFSFSYFNFTWTRINIPVRYLKNKKPDALHLVFIWLGWKDLNPRNNGVRVRCLTTWRRPIAFIIIKYKADVQRLIYYITLFCVCQVFFSNFSKKFFLNFFQTVLRLTHDDLYSISHSAVFVKRFLKKSSNFVFFCIVALLQ